MDTEDFKKVVAEYIDYNYSSGGYNKDKALELADEFECTPGAVVRWASGVANPHPRIKQIIIEYIRKR